MNGLNDSINGLNGHVAVADAPATDTDAGQGMTHAERLELLKKLPPDDFGVMERLTEMLAAGEPIEDVKRWAELETRRLKREKARQEPTTPPPTAKEARAAQAGPDDKWVRDGMPDDINGELQKVLAAAEQELADMDSWDVPAAYVDELTARIKATAATEQAEPPTERETDPFKPFKGDRLMFAEPEPYLQPVGHLARYVLAHLLMGEFGQTLFGDDYLDADRFEQVHGLYIDVRDGIAHGFPGIEFDQMLPAIRACENKFFI